MIGQENTASWKLLFLTDQCWMTIISWLKLLVVVNSMFYKLYLKKDSCHFCHIITLLNTRYLKYNFNKLISVPHLFSYITNKHPAVYKNYKYQARSKPYHTVYWPLMVIVTVLIAETNILIDFIDSSLKTCHKKK